MNVWQHFQQHPDLAQIFNDSMTRITEVVQRAVADVYDFSPYRRIVDVGGGQGRMLAGILAANAQARGVLLDRAPVIEEARRVLANDPAAQRMEFVAGDFFERVPEGGDLYTLKWIIHDWDETRARLLLKNVRQAMAPNARVLLIETVLPEPNTPSFGPLMDLNMLVMTGGRERNATEYRELFAAADLQLVRIYETKSPVSVLEATAPVPSADANS